MGKWAREQVREIPWLSVAPLQLEEFLAQGFLRSREILSPKAKFF